MTMTLEEAAGQLRGAGFLTRMQTFVDHKGESTESIYIRDRKDETSLADRMYEPQFGIDQYKNKNLWYAMSIFAVPISPTIRVSPNLAVLVQAIQDFHTLCYKVTPNRHHDVCLTIIKLQTRGFIVEINDAHALRVRVPLVLEENNLLKRHIMSEAFQLSYREEEFFIRLRDASWQLETWRIGEMQSVTPLATLEEAVQVLARIYDHPTATEEPPRRSDRRQSTDPLSSAD